MIQITTPVADPLTTSPVTRPAILLPADVRDLLTDIRRRLDASLESLTLNASSVRERFQEIEHLLPDELIEALTPVAFMEFHKVTVTRTLRRLSDRKAQTEHLNLAVLAEQKAEEEKKQHEAIQASSAEIRPRLDRLKKERADLQAALAAKEEEIKTEEAALAKIIEELEIHQAALTSAVDQAKQQREAIRVIPGSLEDDLRIINDIDRIRLNAIAMIQRFL